MTIKSVQFYKLSLSLPYLATLILLAFGFLTSNDEVFNYEDNLSNQSTVPIILVSIKAVILIPIALVSIVYILGAPIWLPPYILLTVLLWIWSKEKSKRQIERVFMWTPVYLAILATAFYTLISLFTEFDYLGDYTLASIAICIFPAIIAFGYFFIGMTAWLYDFFRKKGIVQDEPQTIL